MIKETETKTDRFIWAWLYFILFYLIAQIMRVIAG